MNDEELVPAAYRLILSMVIPPLRAKQVPGFQIVWPCGNNTSDWTMAILSYKRKPVFVITSADQYIRLNDIMPNIFNPGKPFIKELDKVPIADPECHVKVMEWFVNEMLKRMNKTK